MDFPRAWVDFTDPAEETTRVRADLTFLTSRWTCIFGAGCCGIDAAMPDAGCCTMGAHFTDRDDQRRVGRVARTLTSEDWQLRRDGRRDGWLERDEEGQVKTRVVDGGCIFLNRPGFPAGPGCALHAHALRTGAEPLTVKPDVCWQLPLRRSYRDVERPDGTSITELTITEYDRRAWGPGGHDLDWYCSGASEAHVGSDPVYVSMRAELEELVGPSAYAVLARLCRDHLDSRGSAAHPASG